MKNITEKQIFNNLAHIERYVLLRSIGYKHNVNPLINFDEDKMQFCVANNKFCLYINTCNFEEFGITNCLSLINKCVVYLIYNEDGIYIGQSEDFNDRMYSHIKDASSLNTPLYTSFRERKTAYVTILHCFDSGNKGVIEGIEDIYLHELIDIKKNNDTLYPFIFNVNK